MERKEFSKLKIRTEEHLKQNSKDKLILTNDVIDIDSAIEDNKAALKLQNSVLCRRQNEKLIELKSRVEGALKRK